MTEVRHLKPWEVWSFPWGVGTKHSKGKWEKVFIGGREIDVSAIEVELDDDGIHFKEEAWK